MQIIIKENEIRVAVQQYIATQGINLAGKSVDIQFTATRSGAGVVAEIDIEDVQAVMVQPVTATVVKAETAEPQAKVDAPKTKTARTVTEIAAAAVNAPLEEEPPVPEEATATVAETPAKTSSLFG